MKTKLTSLERFLYDHRRKEFIKLYDGLVVGREQGDVTYLDDNGMSTKHAIFHITLGEASVIDLNSTNKTKINEKELVANEEYKLKIGDEVCISNQKFTITNNSQNSPDKVTDVKVVDIDSSEESRVEDAGYGVDSIVKVGLQLLLFIGITGLIYLAFKHLPGIFWGIFFSLDMAFTVFIVAIQLDITSRIRKHLPGILEMLVYPIFTFIWFGPIVLSFCIAYAITFIFFEVEGVNSDPFATIKQVMDFFQVKNLH